ncbi:MAG: hypothetical protein M3Q39_15280 [Actinomycetota bacterium]|nr:hypothetical protein [Actinomycetota bacterium]
MNLREDVVTDPLNEWIAGLFAPRRRARTVAQLIGVHEGQRTEDVRVRQARDRLSSAESRIRRLQAAIEAGVNPAALVEAINEAQAQRAAARVELEGLPTQRTVAAKDIAALVDSLGDMAAALGRAEPDKQMCLYQALRLEMRYHHAERTVTVAVAPRVVSGGVRGGT